MRHEANTRRHALLSDATRTLCEALESRRCFNAGDFDFAFSDSALGSIDFGGLKFVAVDTSVSADGKPVVVGKIGANVAVARLNDNGTLDTTFGSGGVFQTNRRTQVTSVDVQGDGKIILGFGHAGADNGLGFAFAIGRILANGSDFDSAFGVNGIAVYGNVFKSTDVVDVIVQRDGMIYAIGQEVTNGLDDRNMSAVRYDQNGIRDAGYGSEGFVYADLGPDTNGLAGALDYSAGGSLGRLVIVGSTSSDQFAVARFTTNGNADNSFDGDGKRTLSNLSPAPIEIADGVAVLLNGQIVVGGYAGNSTGGRDVLVTKLNVNGSTDTTFATNGVYEQDFGGAEVVDEVKIGYLGNVLLAARFNGKSAILAMTNSGALDTRFDDDGVMTTPVPADRASIDPTGELVTPARRVYLAGGTSIGRYYDRGPLITIATIQPTISEAGTTSTTIVVTRSVARAAAETVVINTSGTASIRGTGADVTTSGISIGNGTTRSTTVVIPAGELATTFTVTAINDTAVEPDESLIFSVGSTSNYDAGSPSQAEITIRDNDTIGAPTVQQALFSYETAPQHLTIRFSEDVITTASAFQITGPAGIPGHSYAYDQATNTVRLDFNSVIPTGNYTLKAIATGIHDASSLPLGADYTFKFFFLAGDANHDRVVNFDDLVVVAQNYNKTNKTFSQGNLDYNANGAVNFDDLVILAQQYNKTLAVALTAETPAIKETAKTKDKSTDRTAAGRLSELD